MFKYFTEGVDNSLLIVLPRFKSAAVTFWHGSQIKLGGLQQQKFLQCMTLAVLGLYSVDVRMISE